MTRVSSKPASAPVTDFSTIKKAADVPVDVKAAQLDKMPKADFFALRSALYTDGWQARRGKDEAFFKLMENVENRYQEWGGEGYERTVLGPPAPAKMELVELYKEFHQLTDRKARYGLGEDASARLKDLDHELNTVRRNQAGVKSFPAWAGVLRNSVDG